VLRPMITERDMLHQMVTEKETWLHAYQRFIEELTHKHLTLDKDKYGETRNNNRVLT